MKFSRNKKDPKEKRPKVSKEQFKKSLSILKFLKPFRKKYMVGMVMLVLTSITGLAFPTLLGKLVDSSMDGVMKWDMNTMALILIGILIVQSVFSFFRIYLFADVTESMLVLLRKTLYQKLITLPMSFFSENRVGELNSRISSDISRLQETFTTTLAEFLRQFLIIIGGVVILAVTSWKLTAFMLSIVPLVVIAAVIFGRFIRKISRNVQDELASSQNIVEETLQGIMNVKAFTNEIFEIGRYGKSMDIVRKEALRGAIWRGAFASFIIICLFGAIVGVIWYSMVLVQQGQLSYGDMMTFLLLSVFIGASIGGIAEMYAQIQRAIGATERILELLDEKAETVTLSENERSQDSRLLGNVEFNDVTFSYPSRKDVTVLEHLNFKINAGENVAIVGHSGAGKSTIVSLLLRFFNPVSGEILFDGKASLDFDLSYLRNQMSIVPQEVMLFGGTIKENIAYGKIGSTDEEILLAAEKANAIEFIDKFPEKFETEVGERGVQLSGGQKQRIAIARAILRDPSILILDEATSSLDTENEALVQQALDKVMNNRTSIVIAHRLSTIRKADRILVIKNGKVVEQGPHEDLIAVEDGFYRQLSTETSLS